MDQTGDQATEFLTKEIDAMRSAHDSAVTEMGALERYALLATGAIWSWWATHAKIEGSSYLLWAPALLIFLFGLRAWGIYLKMLSIRRYLLRVEASIGLPDELGWNHYLERHGYRLRVMSAFFFWGLLHATTIVVAIFFS